MVFTSEVAATLSSVCFLGAIATLGAFIMLTGSYLLEELMNPPETIPEIQEKPCISVSNPDLNRDTNLKLTTTTLFPKNSTPPQKPPPSSSSLQVPICALKNFLSFNYYP